ncbi:beta-galactosidase 3 isoform X3 [Manihot esculenta]|uniref:beta-galactosidase 3 isoform X3 n=1 Tax=Manihot esculenta TaxID=3983 RepID=UPI001CC6823E|nr:beta-galactosidase 3 isoform X3 [Manihot esculenta]
MKNLSSALPTCFSLLILPLLFFFLSFTLCFGGNVTYDSRSLIIDGQRKLLISAAIHYPRSVPGMWPELVQTAKEGGVDVIETYVFWNGHEPSVSNYYFEKRFDLVKFAKIVQQAGLYLILRIGPFVAAEWNFGGVPVWLHYVPDTVFRTDNYNFKYHMQKFMTYIVNLMKQEKLFAWQGGPIILTQVENEYGFYESFYGEGGKRYAMWAAEMAVSLNAGVPWIMCQQFDAPDIVINTCNSFYCDQFKPIFPDKPKIWTENWPGWFQTFGAPNPHRPPEDIAFSVARFFQKGGSVQNYYMYHGGTNFGRTSGGPFITTSYDYEAPIDEYGLPRLPKWAHLRELHRAIKLCEHTMLNSNPVNLSLGPSQEADVFADASGACVAFLANTDEKNEKIVEFRNMSYHLPAWSVSILPDCKNVVFNTAKNAGPYYEWVGAGLTSVKIDGFNNGTLDLSTFNWTYKIGLQGEKLGIYKADAVDKVHWVASSKPPKYQPLTWYKVAVDPPAGDEPIGLDMLHMGKGLAWLNGEEIGRYWPRKSSIHEKCVQECDYRGKFMPDKCRTGCGQPTQRWYHVPRSWFKPSGNILVIFEEKGGDPTKITFSRRKISSVCALVSEDYPVANLESFQKSGNGNSSSKASVHLKCPKTSSISIVKFASFGSPTGACGSYSQGECHDPTSLPVVEKVCLNKNECTVEVTEENFTKGLCPGTTKKLAVEAVCT